MTVQARPVLLAIVMAIIAGLILSQLVTVSQALLAACVTLMVILWTNNGLPLAVVSLLPLIIFPAFSIQSTQAVALNYANPIIFLFLGGFLLAIAVEKTALHKWIAAKILNLFPVSPRGIIFSLIFTSGLLSSVLSNTTTALLLLPVALYLTDDKQLKPRLLLAIAYGASVGGILTPIGTPPNLILLGLMQQWGLPPIGFVHWVGMMMPLVILMFFIVGYVLSFRLKSAEIESVMSLPALNSDQKKVISVLAVLVAVLFINAPFHPYYDGLGLSEAGLLLGAGLLLFVPPFSILEWNVDKDKIPFHIMFLFGAGFAIASAFTETGMAKEIALQLLGFAGLPVLVFMLVVAAIVTFTTEITSNTALISIMLPVIYEVALVSGLDVTLFMMIATVCASYAFMLPIATPPNAIIMGSGAVDVKTMAVFGFLLNLAGIISIVFIARIYWAQVL